MTCAQIWKWNIIAAPSLVSKHCINGLFGARNSFKRSARCRKPKCITATMATMSTAKPRTRYQYQPYSPFSS